jgi:hypothetical protein
LPSFYLEGCFVAGLLSELGLQRGEPLLLRPHQALHPTQVACRARLRVGQRLGVFRGQAVQATA